MLNLKKGLVLVVIGASIFFSCEKEDICEGNAATPKVRIELFDKANSTLEKPALKLECFVSPKNASDPTKMIVFKNTAKIQLPLDYNTNEVIWNLRLTQVINNDTIVTTDRIRFMYTPKTEYVSKACGYKSVFMKMSTVINDNGNGNWITNFSPLYKDIINDEHVHAKIYY